MGFVSGIKQLFSSPVEGKEDPQQRLIQELLEDSRQQRREMMALVSKVMDQQAQSQLIQQQMLQQYVAQGENSTTTMDSRLFAKDQKLEEDMWENIGGNPFKALGLDN